MERRQPHHDIDEAVDRLIHLEHKVDVHIERNRSFEETVREFMKCRQERDDKITRRIFFMAIPIISLMISGLVYIIRLEGDIEVIRYRIETETTVHNPSESRYVPARPVPSEP